jgi:uncharacterized membrane protein YhhN
VAEKFKKMSAFFIAALFFVPFFFLVPNWMTKVVPIYCLVLACLFHYPRSKHSLWIAFGLFLSSFGDFLLEWVTEFKAEHYFIPGLIFFLLAHLCYIFGMSLKKIDTSTYFWIPVLAVYYGVIMSKLIPKVENDLKVPIAVYGVVICSMAFFAINRLLSSAVSMTSSSLGFVGSLFFMASDTILSFDKFYSQIPSANFLIMVTYYLAQILIASSVLVTEVKPVETQQGGKKKD